MKTTLTHTCRVISFHQSPNNTPPSPPFRDGDKINSVPEETSNKGVPADLEDGFYFSTLIISYDF